MQIFIDIDDEQYLILTIKIYMAKIFVSVFKILYRHTKIIFSVFYITEHEMQFFSKIVSTQSPLDFCK